MPPKQSKSEVAKKQKVVEEKTFGLKNKNKSKNVQKYVQALQKNVVPKPDASKLAAKKKKDEEKAREKELNELFKIVVVQPKVPPGVDPKSILCEFFKAGQCAKGFKCKFSHDLNVQRKGEKIDIFSDKRDGEDTMEEWDQEMLEKVIESKGKEYNQNKPTDIVSWQLLWQMQLYYCHYRVYVFEWTGTEKKIKRRGHNGLFSKQQIGGQKQNGNLLKGNMVFLFLGNGCKNVGCLLLSLWCSFLKCIMVLSCVSDQTMKGHNGIGGLKVYLKVILWGMGFI